MREPGGDGRYRVAQWATGNIGAKSLREVLRHPELEMVAVWVSSPAKVGLDAGELAGTGEVTGVVATDALAEVVAAAPDCVLYMRQGCDLDEVCALLEAGIDVVTTAGEFHHPGSMDPEVRRRVEAACARGSSSVHSTGSSPGFITEAVPIVLTSIQRRLDRLVIDEYADLSERNSPELLFDIMGYGRDPATYDERRAAHGAVAFGPSLRLVAEAIGRPLDEVTSTGSVAAATHDTQIAAGTIAAGTVAAQRMEVTGSSHGEPLLVFRATWYCTAEIDADWDLRATGWHVEVVGDSPLDVDLRFPVPLDRMAETTPGYTANRAVNAVAAVCRAAPGIRTTADLPQIVARLG